MIGKAASVRDTLRIIILIATTSALFLACFGFAGLDLFRFRNSLEADLITLADVVGSNSAASLLFRDSQSAVQTLEALEARPSIVAARLYDSGGLPFVSRVTPSSTVKVPQAAPQPYVRFSARSVEVVRPIVYRTERIGMIYIAADLRELYSQLEDYAIVGIGILLASVLVALVVSSLLERLLTGPILRLSRLADQVRREKNYALRTSTDLPSPRELTVLTSAFNDMLAEIHQRDQKLRRHREELQEQVEARTRELRATAELNESLSNHKQTILDTASEGIFGLDANGIARFVNASAGRLLGYDVADLLGRPLHEIVHAPEGRVQDAFECEFCSVTTGFRVSAGGRDVFVARDGQTFPVEYASSVMSGGMAGVVVTFRDITERQAVERMKSEFVATVSHELRTPLTSIRGSLGLLSGGFFGSLNERGQRMMSIALANTERLARLVDEILDLERITSGKVHLNRSVNCVADLMHDAVDVVQAIADRSSINVEIEPNDALLWVDRDRLVQTLTNLLGNAVKFSPAGSTIRVSGGHPEGDDTGFLFSIADSGRGIPADKVETIFERFQQLDASDSRDKGGSGLGLAICRSIVSAHGGRIWAKSRLGEGSTFQFTVPLAFPRVVGLNPNLEPEEAALATQGTHRR